MIYERLDRLISFILEISPVSSYYYIGHWGHRIDGARSIGTKKGNSQLGVFFLFFLISFALRKPKVTSRLMQVRMLEVCPFGK